MAYAGNPSDLANKPAASSGQAGSWQPLLIVIVVAAIFVVVALATVFVPAKALPAGNSGHAQIEALRGAAGPWSVVPQSFAPVDRGYEQIEKLQGSISRMVYQTVVPQSFAPVDRSYEQIEKLQGSISRMVYLTADPVDHRYDNIDNVEALRGNMR